MKLIKKLLLIVSVLTAGLSILGLIVERKSQKNNREQNPFENKKVAFVEDGTDEPNADGVRGHLEIIGDAQVPSKGLYERVVKRGLDVLLSSLGLVVLSPVLALISVAVYLDDPGPVFFTQKRIGINKSYFRLYKFRSMKMSTPKDTPTHMLENPEKCITSVGAVLRRTSGDELPQLFDIWKGDMSVIGPRPALWNQDHLISEREKHGVNEHKPGLTGLAQIRGRDELEIPDKAALDGEYTKVLKTGGLKAFKLDVTCFFGTLKSVLYHDGVVEGGTGRMR